MSHDGHAYEAEELAEVARLLANVPGMNGDRARRVAEELRHLFQVEIREPDSAQDLVFLLGACRQGLLPLLKLIGMRADWFPDHPATRAIEEHLLGLCGQSRENDETAVILRRIREVRESLDGDASLDRYHAREAFFTTLDVNLLARLSPTEARQPETIREIVEHLLANLVGEIAAAIVLEFLTRLSILCDREAGAPLMETVRQLSHGLPTYEQQQLEIDERLRLWKATQRRRTHLLARIERDMDSDPDDAATDQTFTVTLWKYTDDRFGWMPPPLGTHRSSRKEKPTTATGSDLAARIRTKLRRDADRRTVVELMVDDATLVTTIIDAVINDLCRDFAVVIRPMNPSAENRRWFANWQTVLRVTDFGAVLYDGARFDEPPTTSALVINSYGEPTKLPEALLSADVPIAAWKQHGGTIDAGPQSCVRASFDTPELFQNDRREGRLPDDAVLMWHNPHWFPNGPALQWRGAPA